VQSSFFSRKKMAGILSSIVLVFAGSQFIHTTLAANININSGAAVEFGQGIAMSAACSGNSVLTVTPYSSFTNTSGSAGTFYFSSVSVSGIPAGCNGVDFLISVYDSSTSTPLSIFNSNSTVATVADQGGNFSAGANMTGASVSSTSRKFVVTFSSPVALAKSVSKITLQSTAHAPTCLLDGLNCSVGETGPGGGTIFYASAGFTCGPTYSSTCHYLEVAPAGWNGGSDPAVQWAFDPVRVLTVTGITNDRIANLNSSSIGLGYSYTQAIVAQGNAVTNYNTNHVTAANITRAYYGGGRSDWYLPDTSELNALCKYVSGNAWVSDATQCGGSMSPLLGFSITEYFSSSEYDEPSDPNIYRAFVQTFSYGGIGPMGKDNAFSVRPIRAF
jgi:hypothetical protein